MAKIREDSFKLAPVIQATFEKEKNSEFLRASKAGFNSSTRNSRPQSIHMAASGDGIEDEIERSKVHWSELREPCEEHSEKAEDANRTYLGACEQHTLWSRVTQCFGESVTKMFQEIFADRKEREDSQEILEFLLQNHIPLGSIGERLVLGQQIAEGVQAKIYKAEWINDDGRKDGSKCTRIFKVFKKKLSLQNLRQECPLQTLRIGQQGDFTCMYHGTTLLRDGRIAFVFDKYWGNLHTLIEMRTKQNPNAPPFEILDAVRIMLEVARGMRELHRKGILHRDVKPANILVDVRDDEDPVLQRRLLFSCKISDFESSLEVVGTGSYRAPEILRHISGSQGRAQDPFTEKADVYSYAMTCYEILTGRMPFEGHPRSDYDMILVREERPTLPDHVQPWIRALLGKCWHTDPSRRPSFHEIEDELIWTNKVKICTWSGHGEARGGSGGLVRLGEAWGGSGGLERLGRLRGFCLGGQYAKSL